MTRRKIGNLIYPIFMYYLIELIVYYVLGFVTGDSGDTSLKLQFFSNLCTIPFLAYLMLKNPLYMWVKESKEKDIKGLLVKFGLCLLAGFSVSVFLNVILGLVFTPGVAYTIEDIQRSFFDNELLFKIVSLVIVSPLSEELMYRGIIFNYMRRNFSRRSAYIVSALLFGIIHMNLIQFVYAALFGFVLALFAEKMDIVWAAVIIHAISNLISILNDQFGIFKPIYEAGVFTEILFMIIMGVAGVCTIIFVKDNF